MQLYPIIYQEHKNLVQIVLFENDLYKENIYQEIKPEFIKHYVVVVVNSSLLYKHDCPICSLHFYTIVQLVGNCEVTKYNF